MRMVRVYGVCACPVHALCMPCACPVHAVYAGEPVQHAAAIDDPRVQVAGQQKVELLQEQRGGQTDSEEAERSAVEEEGPHASGTPRAAGKEVWGDNPITRTNSAAT